ncbi:hypothetical protein ABK040_002287 [Willaertia magna]
MGNLQKSKYLLLFLHGFPQTASTCFYHQFKFLQNNNYTENDYYILAPDLRGYNQSDKPDINNVYNYDIGELVMDVKGLINYFHKKKMEINNNNNNNEKTTTQETKVILIGHDWGGIIAWFYAIHFPQDLEKLIILDVPYPNAIQNISKDRILSQMKRSWYVFLLQLGWNIPERYFIGSDNNYNRLINMFIEKPIMNKYDTDLLRIAFKEKDSITAMFNYYRAMVRESLVHVIRKKLGQPELRRFPEIVDFVQQRGGEEIKVKVPTLIFWGTRDVCIEEELADISFGFIHSNVKNKSKLLKYDAGHFVMIEKYEEVNKEIADFIKMD